MDERIVGVVDGIVGLEWTEERAAVDQGDERAVAEQQRAHVAEVERRAGLRLHRAEYRGAAALAALALAACGAEPLADSRSDVPERPNVVLVTLDTTRADHLGLYGYALDTSPHLDRLAEEAVVYTRAVSTSSWTLPAHASLFTGRIPTGHGATLDPEGPLLLLEAIEGPDAYGAIRASGVSPALPTLAERLRDAGFATAGVAGGPWLEEVFGLARGFDYYADDGIDSIAGARAEQVNETALAFLDAIGSRPFFLFVNYFDPHGPRTVEDSHRLALGLPPDDGSLPAWIALYDAEIRYMDEHVGRLVEELRRRGLWEDALVIVVADHGERLGERDKIGHGNTLTEAEIHVPLLVKYPRGERGGERVTTRVSIASIFASILEHVSLPVPDGVAPPLERADASPVIAEVYPPTAVSTDGHWRAIYQGNYKAVWSSVGRNAFYDLSRDPEGRYNRIGSERRVAEEMLSMLEQRIASTPRPPRSDEPPRAVGAKTREALRNLGYLE